MRDKFTSATAAIILSGNSPGQSSVSLGVCFNLDLTRKSRKFFGAFVSDKWSIFEGLFTTFHSSKDRNVLFNGITMIWKSRIIGGDRSVSIFLRLVLTDVAAWNFGSFFDLGLDVPSFVSPIRMLTVHWFFCWNFSVVEQIRRILNARLKGMDSLT